MSPIAILGHDARELFARKDLPIGSNYSDESMTILLQLTRNGAEPGQQGTATEPSRYPRAIRSWSHSQLSGAVTQSLAQDKEEPSRLHALVAPVGECGGGVQLDEGEGTFSGERNGGDCIKELGGGKEREMDIDHDQGRHDSDDSKSCRHGDVMDEDRHSQTVTSANCLNDCTRQPPTSHGGNSIHVPGKGSMSANSAKSIVDSTRSESSAEIQRRRDDDEHAHTCQTPNTPGDEGASVELSCDRNLRQDAETTNKPSAYDMWVPVQRSTEESESVHSWSLPDLEGKLQEQRAIWEQFDGGDSVDQISACFNEEAATNSVCSRIGSYDIDDDKVTKAVNVALDTYPVSSICSP